MLRAISAVVLALSLQTGVVAQTAYGPYKAYMEEMTGDTCVDLVIGYQGAGVVAVEQGDCGAGLTRIATNAYVTPDAAGDRHVHNIDLFDINGDGAMDAAIAIGGMNPSTPGTIIVSENVGSGVLTERARFSVPSQAKGVALGDFNGDGLIDLAATAAGRGSGGDIAVGRLYIWPGLGGFSFGAPVYIETGFVAYNIRTGDIDGNGTPDFVVPNAHTDFVSVILNPGPTLFAAPPSPVSLHLPQPPGYAVPRLNDAEIADFDQDGLLDIVAVSTNGGLVGLWHGRGDGTFRAPQTITAGAEFAAFAAVCDANGDSYPDVVVSHYTGMNRTSVLVGSAGGLLPAQAYATGLGSYGVTCANYDAPGSPVDAITANYASRSISMMRGNGDGTFGAPGTIARGIKMVGGTWVAE